MTHPLVQLWSNDDGQDIAEYAVIRITCAGEDSCRSSSDSHRLA